MSVSWKSVAVLAAAGAAFVIGMPQANAQSGDWSLTATGVSSHGSWTRSGTVYDFSAVVKDTKADGDCAYVTLRPQVHYGYTGTWLSVGTSGYEVRKEVCGEGKSLYSYPSFNVVDHMSALDKTAGDSIRVLIKACRNENNSGDTCSETTTPPAAF